MPSLVGVDLPVLPVPVLAVLDLVLVVLDGQAATPEGQSAWLAQKGVGMLETVAVQVVLLLPWLLIYVH